MREKKVYDILDGYCIRETHVKMNIDDACNMMKSKWRYRYTKGTRVGDEILFVRHTILCPHCGEEIPAYQRFIEPAVYERRGRKCEVSDEDIELWTSRQLTLFEKEKTLRFNYPMEPDVYRCVKCGYQSEYYKSAEEVTVEHREKQITLSYDVFDLQQIFSLPFIEKEEISLRFPLTESVVFDVEAGRIYLRLVDVSEAILTLVDVTNQMEVWKQRESYRLLKWKPFLLYRVADEFAVYWPNGEIPFGKEELSCEKLAMMTMFVGYPRKFYDEIPTEGENGNIADGFLVTTECLHNPDNVNTLLCASSLPMVKSVRRVVFQQPGYTFYMKELELLYDILKDVNLLLQVLESDGSFEILSFLREYGGTESFFRDYVEQRGAIVLVARLKRNWCEVISYAVGYSSMSEHKKEKERKSWGKGTLRWGVEATYSRPIATKETNIKNCSIDGFSFLQLQSTGEFYGAGLEMDNCLRGWKNFVNSNVFVVKRDGEYKAAIEVKGKRIWQIRGRRNGALEKYTGLEEAILKWTERFGLENYEMAYEDDEEDELPF